LEQGTGTDRRMDTDLGQRRGAPLPDAAAWPCLRPQKAGGDCIQKTTTVTRVILIRQFTYVYHVLLSHMAPCKCEARLLGVPGPSFKQLNGTFVNC
jgi:hypothetical protein